MIGGGRGRQHNLILIVRGFQLRLGRGLSQNNWLIWQT